MQEETTKRVPPPQIQEVAKALSGDLRLRILEILDEEPLSVSQLTEMLGVAQPTVSINLQMLEQAGLIETAPGSGREKLCSRFYDTLLLEIPRKPGGVLSSLESVSMPVGMYSDIAVAAPCGLVGPDGLIGDADDPRSFYLPERSNAWLLWLSDSGYVEYRFPNPVPKGEKLKGIAVSAELCSEAPGYREDWPSDITLSVNGKEIGTWTSPGDFGAVKGVLTPAWWVGGTQYGQLNEWQIDHKGSLLNGQPCSQVCLQDLELQDDRPITVRFEVKADAVNRGGFNLLGSRFGNSPQDVKLSFRK
ncbi:ArsR/SmtB family transcription factor [Paenibacillus sp. MBLB4367]|uniref:ArsR/SmtB family transcription factor n=1 Tax=Paenibacillus sp. MBLB4367 TaxID=3384767 RepID=UPI00390814FA